MKTIRNVRFVWNCLLNTSCELYCDDATVVSVMMNIKYGDVTDESIPQGTLHV